MLPPLRCPGLVLAASLAAVATAQALPAELADRPMAGCRLPPAVGPDGNFAATRWTGGNVPYVYAANVTPAMATAMAAAMQELQSFANVHFVPRGNEVDYVQIRDSAINSSPVGRVGGLQLLHVFNWNSRFEMVHELLHVLGYWHEHQRPDRDQFVAVQSANVDPTRATDFEIVPTGDTFGRPYDFDSVLHFAGTEASSNGGITLLVLPPNGNLQNSIGQRTHLSSGDRDAVRLVYGSSTPPAITGVTPGSVTTWQPAAITLTGALLDETTRVLFDASPLSAFTILSATQLRFTLPNLLPIGAHAVQVENLAGRSAPAALQITGNDPPVLEAPTVVLRNIAFLYRIHTDATRTNLLLVAFDNQPSVLPGVISLGLGSQFTTLGLIGSGIGGSSGVVVFNLTVPPSVPSGARLWFQSLVYDPAGPTLPITVSNLASVGVF